MIKSKSKKNIFNYDVGSSEIKLTFSKNHNLLFYNLPLDYMENDSDITPPNDNNGDDFKWSIYNLVCHGADRANLDHFLIPEQMEVIFFTLHGDYLKAEVYMDSLFQFITSLNNQDNFMDRYLKLNSVNIRYFEIFNEDKLCPDYELNKFTQTEINNYQNIKGKGSYMRYLSFTIHGLSTIYPNLRKYGLDYKYLSKVVDSVNKKRKPGEYIVLFACICRA